MRILALLFLLPSAICTHLESKIVPTNDSLKLETVNLNSYVVMLKPPRNILDNITDTVVDEFVTSLNLKPKRKYKHGRVKGFSAVLSSRQLKSLKSNSKVCKTT